jgi:regulator of sigma E protease
LLNVGFKTGDQIVSVDGEKSKFDNDWHESDHGQRSCSKRNGTRAIIKCLIDFVDQLSKQEKSLL